MLPSLPLLAQIPQQILKISNRQGEFKRQIHYGCYLLCEKAGLRVSEALNFDLSAKTRKGLYRLNKVKGKKERFVYIPKKVIKELKKHHWKPQQTNRFNFYHFLKKIRHELNLPTNIELTPHTLRRAFATYQAEAGLPLPLLSKLLGHKSVRTTALYWMNIYNEDDDDTKNILAGKFWLEKPKKPSIEPATPAKISLELPELLIPNSLASEPPPNYLSKIQQLESQLSQIQGERDELTREKEILQNDLAELNEQNINLQHEKSQIQQNLSTATETIKQLKQDLVNEQEKRTIAENNLAQEREVSTKQKQISHNLRQQLQTEQEINANLRQKIYVGEQNYSNLLNTYQITLKDKEKAEKQANYYENQLKSFAKSIYQWQKLNYYQQLEQERKELKAQIIQPPPWKLKN